MSNDEYLGLLHAHLPLSLSRMHTSGTPPSPGVVTCFWMGQYSLFTLLYLCKYYSQLSHVVYHTYLYRSFYFPAVSIDE